MRKESMLCSLHLAIIDAEIYLHPRSSIELSKTVLTGQYYAKMRGDSAEGKDEEGKNTSGKNWQRKGMKENRRALLDNLGELFPCTLCSTAWFPPHYWRISHCQAIATPSRLYFPIMASLPLHNYPHKIVFSLMCVQTVNSMHGS